MAIFSEKQINALRRDLDLRVIRTRERHGKELHYIEGWYAISEANRIFGFDRWARETVETRCVFSRENRGNFHAVYIAKVRITVRGQDAEIAREGHGTGEAHGGSPGEVHDVALKAAETDATKRALTTFGKRFGLMLYGRKLRNNKISQNVSSAEDGAVERYPNTPFRNDDMDWVPLQLDEINKIDKSLLRFGAPRRIRNRAHLKYIAAQSCLICGRVPSDAHHLKFAQPRALGLKVSDEFTVPLCRGHHRELHNAGNELKWWEAHKIDALAVAASMWQRSQAPQSSGESFEDRDNLIRDQIYKNVGKDSSTGEI
jgi:hypothetical protein